MASFSESAAIFSIFSEIFGNCEFLQLFFSQSPSLLFIFLGICRYISLYRSTKARISLSSDSDSSDSDRFSQENAVCLPNEPQQSYFIKRRLSYFQAGVYFLAIALGFLARKTDFCTAGRPVLGLCYGIGAFAWVLSAKLVEIELEKEYSQELYTHKLFCPLSLLVSAGNLAIFDCLPLDFALHCVKVALNLLLSLYFLAKPSDFATNSEETPGFLAQMLNKFEAFAIVRLIFGLTSAKDRKKRLVMIPLLEIPQNSRDFFEKPRDFFGKPRDFFDFFGKPRDFLEKPGDCLENPHDFLQKIPKTHSFKRKFREKLEKPQVSVTLCADSLDDLGPFFRISTEIDEKRHTVRRSVDELAELRDFCVRSWKEPRKLPDFQAETGSIQRFFEEILTDSAFLQPKVLEFLGVCSFSKKSLVLANKSQFSSGNLSPNLRRNSENLLETRDFLDFSQSSTRNLKPFRSLKFEVQCLGWEKSPNHDYYVFLFQLSCENHAWMIKKSVSEVKSFNVSLEETLKKSVVLYQNSVPKKTATFKEMDAEFLEKRRLGLENYMRAVLSDSSLFARILFDFIEFDCEKRVPFEKLRGNDEDEEILRYSEDELDPVEEKVAGISQAIGRTSQKFARFSLETADISEFRSAKDPRFFEKAQRNPKENLSPSFKGKRRVVSDINFNHVRLVFVGIARVPVQNPGNQGNNAFARRHFTVSAKTEKIYVIKLEETEPNSAIFSARNARNLRTEIKMARNYKELEEFHRIIRKNFENDCDFELPAESEEKPAVDSEENKRWEEYFSALLNIPMVEENQTFKEFFYLDKARNKYLFDYERKETFKLDLTNF